MPHPYLMLFTDTLEMRNQDHLINGQGRHETGERKERKGQGGIKGRVRDIL